MPIDRNLSPCMSRRVLQLAVHVAVAMFGLHGLALAQESAASCGSLANAFGPFDYRNEHGNPKSLVESAHFTAEVEALIKGNGGYLGGDLDYTLRAFPNHHRALLAVARYGERTKSIQAPNTRYTVECYFVRAVTFRPDDTTARMLFASFLHKRQRTSEAMAQLAYVSERVGDNAFTAYNLGLLYLEIGDPARALQQAHRAQALGFMRPELKAALVKAGKWSEPAPDKADEPASGVSGAAPSASAAPTATRTSAAPAASAP